MALSPALAGQVSGVEVGQGATGTRAEIRLAGKGEFKTISLHGPERLVVDLPASTAAAGLRLPAGAGIVKSVRTGQPEPGTLRIVFDLAAPVVALKPRMEPSANGSSLVIEWPGDGPAAAAAAAAVATTNTANPAAATVPEAPAPTAAEATAALTSTVARQAAAPTQPVPAATATASAATPASLSPEAILNGQAPAAVPTGSAAATTIVPAGAVPAATPPEPAAASMAAQPAAAAAPKVAMRGGMRPLVIAIDAGHGGQDSGAIGPTGKYEKNVTLAIARELARQVDATPGMKAYLVRDGDYFIPLPQRAQKARAAKADLFVSIHADAAENRSASGSSVYVLSLKGASSQRARWLADKENASDLVGGVKLQKVDNTLSSVLIDLAQSGHMKASEDAAGHVLQELGRIGNSHKPHLERANFAVLRTSDMPAMLVETAFISNYSEERLLTTPAYQRKIASAVLGGVQSYFTRQPPPGTLFAARAQAADIAAVGGAGGSP